MRMLVRMLLVLVCFSVFAEDADARWFGRRNRNRGYVEYNGGTTYTYTPTKYSTEKRFLKSTMSLQDIAQVRVNAMAQTQNLTHSIEWNVEGVPGFPNEVAEGIGCATANDPKNVGTCVCGSKVVADAHCKSRNGMIYRVRFWR